MTDDDKFPSGGAYGEPWDALHPGWVLRVGHLYKICVKKGYTHKQALRASRDIMNNNSIADIDDMIHKEKLPPRRRRKSKTK